MITIEQIHSAEAQVAGMQQALDVVQSGLERAGTAAEAAETVKRRFGRPAKVLLVLAGVAAVVLVVSRVRNEPESPEPEPSV